MLCVRIHLIEIVVQSNDKAMCVTKWKTSLDFSLAWHILNYYFFFSFYDDDDDDDNNRSHLFSFSHFQLPHPIRNFFIFFLSSKSKPVKSNKKDRFRNLKKIEKKSFFSLWNCVDFEHFYDEQISLHNFVSIFPFFICVQRRIITRFLSVANWI